MNRLVRLLLSLLGVVLAIGVVRVLVLPEPAGGGRRRVTRPRGARRGAVPDQAVAERGRLDVNRASAGQLAALPGMTPELASRILQARPFSRPAELLTRRVLSPTLYHRIKGRLTVKGAPTSRSRRRRTVR